jgi:nucleoid-associated protein YgaU
MSLFDFVKDVGKKLFPSAARPEDAAAKIHEEIEAAGLGITGLGVTFANGNVRLTGTSPTAAAMEKAALIAGNVEGVSNVDTSGLVAPLATEVVEYYVVEKGDSLSKIALRYYGDASLHPRIFDANREVIRDPNLIYPGQKLRIPKARVPTA